MKKPNFDINLACHYYDLGFNECKEVTNEYLESYRLPLIIGCVCLFLLGIVVGVCI
jgi:hypothetical protein